jgi:hypothetical protein
VSNPFNSDHILWVDAGFSRFLPANTTYTFTGSTVSFALQADELPPSSLTFENYVETNQCILHGWLWVVRSAAALRAVMDQVFAVWDRMMTDGRLDNEQIALALGYRANPAVFDARVVRGDGAIFHQFFSAHK